MLIGFVINPIAGMGGRVGLKGTDEVLEEAIKRGAKPIAAKRAREFLKNLKGDIEFITASGKMGEDVLKDFNFPYRVVYKAPKTTSAKDTKEAVGEFMKENAELIVFVGGDGTARDVVKVADSKIPVLGVPSGVKMYSSIFAVNPEKAAEVVMKFLEGGAKLMDSEVLDIDENAYRKNKLRIKLFGYAKTPYVEDLIQSSKSEYVGSEEEEDKRWLAEFFVENIEKDTLYLLGAGTTVAKIAEVLGLEKTLLGVDALYNGKIIAKDLSENEILELIEKYPKVKIVITPIGSQGFIFGRGNQQFSERVLEKVGKENIIIVATSRKIRELKKLRIDLENAQKFRGYYKVLVGYGKYKLMKVE